jgi:hypothetical protein
MDKIRENKKTMPLDEAMESAIKYCIENNILSSFLLEKSSEVFNMLLTEWNWDDAKEVWQEEAGEVKALEIAKKSLDRGLPVDTVSEITGLAPETVKNLLAE